METFSALLAICAGNSPVTGEFLTQRPVTRSFDVFFNKWLSKQSRCWWFETPSCPLWRRRNAQTSFCKCLIWVQPEQALINPAHSCSSVCVNLIYIDKCHKWQIRLYDDFNHCLSSWEISRNHIYHLSTLLFWGGVYYNRRLSGAFVNYREVSWAPWRLKSPVTWLFVQKLVQTDSKGNI